MAFWPAILALVVLLFVPDGGGWAQVGFVLALTWLSIAAADRLAFERQWVCDQCGSTFTPEPKRDTGTKVEPDPRSEPPIGEVVTLAPTAKHHLTDGKTCSICGEWFPHAEFRYGNRENRSYCRTCNREERVAYAESGRDGARRYRAAMRAKWKGAESGARGL
jgi:hypothetical protein